MYFLVGRFDVNAMTQLCERYYNVLGAPHKELIWFEKSGHTPMQYEPNKVMDVMLRLPDLKAQGFYRRCTSLHLFGKESGCRPRELEADEL